MGYANILFFFLFIFTLNYLDKIISQLNKHCNDINFLIMLFFLVFVLFPDALLADLQNSVPGSQQNPLNPTYSGQNGSAVSGYGSLRPRQSPQSVIFLLFLF